jgi:hypothetical protein
MDYSAAADVPVGKSFDNIIESDIKGNFMVENSAKCFNHCVIKITDTPLNSNEQSCLKDCFAKSFYTFSLLD